MTGENFKRISRKNTGIDKAKEQLEQAKDDFTKYAKNADNVDWNWNELHRLGDEVKKLEHELYCLEYEDNRRRNWS